ncbi:MAG: hypothetical protein KF847_13580 [Pirellulales bacterium]|nr:hypothetical protein [Pirellulales bacterium]
MTRVLHRERRGAMLVECFVAAGVLMTAVGIVATIIVQQGRLAIATRHERLVLEELSNQLDRLTLFPPDEAAAALDRLAPSPRLVDALDQPRLVGRLRDDADGSRIELGLEWSEGPGRERRRALVGWLIAPGDAPAGAQGESP